MICEDMPPFVTVRHWANKFKTVPKNHRVHVSRYPRPSLDQDHLVTNFDYGVKFRLDLVIN